MAKINAARRKKLPRSDFGEPAKRAYPMPDKGHAADAKARASEAVDDGRIPRSTEAKIDAKANRKLGEPGAAPREHPKTGSRDGLGHGRGGLAVHPSARAANIDNQGSMHRERY